MKKQMLVLGGGFAGLWSALAAARKLAEFHAEAEIEITLVDRTTYHNIRVRNYEADLSDVCIPLKDLLTPVGVRFLNGEVSDIDVLGRRVSVQTRDGLQSLGYDRLVLAVGSEVVRPPIPGLEERAFDVDTYAAAARLAHHIDELGAGKSGSGQFTAVVIGAGLTGLEVTTELPQRLTRIRERSASREPVRVVLVDRLPHVGSDMGPHARPVIEEALRSLGIETRLSVSVERIEPSAVELSSGERIDASTVIWCAGMRANPLTDKLPGERDRLGRLKVDPFLRIAGVPHAFAAGDVANIAIDGAHPSVMSCQHGRPMGRFAGNNAAADLLGKPMLPLRIDWYVTVLDLGPWGGIHTSGWDRRVIATGAQAKATKRDINCHRIYPPRSLNREDLFAAAAPELQPPPQILGD